MAAELVARPEDYRWSSARAHLAAKDDELVTVMPLLEMVGEWRTFLAFSAEAEVDLLHRHERTGRPLGRETFVAPLETSMGRCLRPQKPGTKKNGALG